MKSKNRRESLKIIGAVGATCAFPFSSDSLYGQHTHPAPGTVQIAPAGPYKSQNFAEPEFTVISRVADLIIPPTDTAGAVAAGVPLVAGPGVWICGSCALTALEILRAEPRGLSTG